MLSLTHKLIETLYQKDCTLMTDHNIDALFKDEEVLVPRTLDDFSPLSMTEGFNHLFSSSLAVVLGGIALVVLAFLLYGFINSCYKSKSTNDYVSGVVFSVVATGLIFTSAVASQIPSLVAKNANVLIPDAKFENVKVVNDFVNRIPEYKDKLNEGYDPDMLYVYKADMMLDSGARSEVYIFTDSTTGNSSVRILTDDALNRLAETQKDSVRH